MVAFTLLRTLFSAPQFYNIGSICSILQVRKLRPRKLDSLVTGQGLKVSKEMACLRPVRVRGEVSDCSGQKKWAFQWLRGVRGALGEAWMSVGCVAGQRAFGIYPEGDAGLKGGALLSERELGFPIPAPNCHSFQCHPAHTWRTLAGPGFWAQALVSSCKGASCQGKNVLLPPSGCGGP